MVYCCKMGLAPDYLIDLLPSATHNHLLSISTSGSIPPARCRTSLASAGSFSVVGPKIWNNLPPAVQSKVSTDSFRKCLKTFLFSRFYPKDLSSFIFSFSYYFIYLTLYMYSILEMVLPG